MENIYVKEIENNQEIMDWNYAKEYLYPVLRPDREKTEKTTELVSSINLDLVIYYTLQFPLQDGSTAVVNVSNKLLKNWEITETILHERAITNMKEDGYQIRDIESIIREMFGETVEHSIVDMNADMYVLSNRRNVEGSAGLLYREFIGTFAEKRESDLYILPSSIHELILIPVGDRIEVDILKQMVEEVNKTQVLETEQLGSNIFLYKRKTKDLSIIL
jgi:hypothetical protein